MVTFRQFARNGCRAVADRLPDYAAVNLQYLRHFGRLPDLRNPTKFSEKIAWRKLYQRDPAFTVFADKLAVKTEISKLVGNQYVIDTLWSGADPARIPFDRLAAPYVIKVNHSSGANVFVRTGDDIDRASIVREMREQLAFSHGHLLREWGYLGIPPCVIVERMLELPNGDVPDDYKFFVYHGRAHFIQVDCERFTGHTRKLYHRDWQLIPGRLHYPENPKTIARPATLLAMIELAEAIGARFDFARIDLYSVPAGVYFGEATFYPGAGLEVFSPVELDTRFGAPWNVSTSAPAGSAAVTAVT